MQALAVFRDGAKVVSRERQSLPDHLVEIRVHACGICGSDLHRVRDQRFVEGQVLGHEISGEIIAVGSAVKGMSAGTRVAINPLGGCGECNRCLNGLPRRCVNAPHPGSTAVGGFAEAVVAHPHQLAILPESVSNLEAAGLEPLSVAVRATRVGKVKAGDRVVVFGCGPIGLRIIQVCRALGAEVVAGVELSGFRKSLALAAGAAQVVETLAGAEVRAIDVAFECSGARSSLSSCAATLGPTGSIVQVARSGFRTSVTLFPLLGPRQSINGAAGTGSRWEFDEALSLLSSGAVRQDILRPAYVTLADAGRILDGDLSVTDAGWLLASPADAT